MDAHGSACLVVDANVTLPHCLRVSGDVTIHGAEGTAVSANGASCHFNVSSGATLALHRMRLLDGRSGPSSTACGGSVFVGEGGTARLNNTAIHGSRTDGNGGAICVNGYLQLMDSQIMSSHAQKDGGAIYVSDSGHAHIIRSRVEGAAAEEGDGGGIHNNGTVEMVGSDLVGCVVKGQGGSAKGRGAAVFQTGGTCMFTDVRIGNSTWSDTPGVDAGVAAAESLWKTWEDILDQVNEAINPATEPTKQAVVHVEGGNLSMTGGICRAPKGVAFYFADSELQFNEAHITCSDPDYEASRSGKGNAITLPGTGEQVSQGGGFHFGHGAHGEVRNTLVSDCIRNLCAGSLSAQGSDVRMQNTTFARNQNRMLSPAGVGAGDVNSNGFVGIGTVCLLAVDGEQNDPVAVYSKPIRLSLYDCTFEDNRAEASGALVYALMPFYPAFANSRLVMRGITSNNNSAADGSLVYVVNDGYTPFLDLDVNYTQFFDERHGLRAFVVKRDQLEPGGDGARRQLLSQQARASEWANDMLVRDRVARRLVAHR